MANPAHHAISSAKRFGGEPEDYIDIHQWFDATKIAWADNRHRALHHHTFGIDECIKTFGDELGMFTRKSDGKRIPVRYIGEQHCFEDCGRIPTIEDWLGEIPRQGWMEKASLKLSKILTEEQEVGLING